MIPPPPSKTDRTDPLRRAGAGLTAALLVALALAPPLAAQTGPGGEVGSNLHREYPRGAWADSVRRLDPFAFRFRRALFDVTERARLNRRLASAEGIQALGTPDAPLAVEGTYRFPVLVGRFGAPDDEEPHPIADLHERLWSPGYSGGGHQGSVRDYYQEVSYGLLTLTGDTYGYAAADSSVDRYRDASGSDAGFGEHMIDWVDEVIDALDPVVDFSRFDANGDGFVDTLVLVHNMAGFECGNLPASRKGFWSHRWNYYSMSYWYRGTAAYRTTDDGVLIDDYVMQPMVGCDGSSLIPIGVFTHELGHAFGLPDYYDTDGAGSGGESEGLGHWGLMASGNWNAPSSPAHMSAISKAEMGWVDPVEISTRDTLGILVPRVNDHPFALKIRSEAMAPGEYFLVENRQAVGFDQHLHGTGLLVYHVNETVSTANRNPSDLRWAVEQADGLFDLERNRNRGDAGDPWAGTTDSRWFWGGGVPSSDTRSRVESHVELILRESTRDTMSVDILSIPRFTLLGPAPGMRVRDGDVTLRWEEYEPPFFWGEVAYEVQVDSDPDFPDPYLAPGTSGSLELTASLPEGLTHYWRIRAHDGGENARFNTFGPGSFTVDGTPPRLRLRPSLSAVDADELTIVAEPSESLDTLRAELDGIDRVADRLPGDAGWVFTLPLGGEGPSTLTLDAVDRVGNASTVEHALRLQRVRGDRSHLISSGSGRFEALVPSGAVTGEGWSILLERTGGSGGADESGDTLLSPVYWLSLPELAPDRGVEVRMAWSAGELPAGHTPVIWGRTGDMWSPRVTGSDAGGRTAVVRTASGGSFQLRSRAAGEAHTPGLPALAPPWPNPFNSSTRIAFDLAEEQTVSLEVYNSRGQKVRELTSGVYPPGRHVVTWEGRDGAGRRVASGIYLVLLRTPGGAWNRKVTLIR
ncbi:MAG: M6 family metalloprotease domain-containing protein [bacterium]